MPRQLAPVRDSNRPRECMNDTPEAVCRSPSWSLQSGLTVGCTLVFDKLLVNRLVARFFHLFCAFVFFLLSSSFHILSSYTHLSPC